MEGETLGDVFGEPCTLDGNGYVVDPCTLAGNDPCISPKEVKQHCSRDTVWVGLFGKVYDLTDFLALHPGGDTVIVDAAGKDVTRVWAAIHKRELLEEHLQPEWCLGNLVAPEGVAPLAEHEFEKPEAAAPNGDGEAEEAKVTSNADFKLARKRRMRNQPVSLGYTYQLIDALVHVQSGLGSKDSAMDRIVNLVEDRGDPNCTDEDGGGGNTPLLFASTIGSDEHVQRLLQANADPLYKTMRGFTALHKFAARPLPDARAPGILTALLEARCNVNAQTTLGRAPLHVAVQWGHPEMCQMLLAKGAERRLRAGVDGTPQDWARVCHKDKRKLDALLRVLNT